MAIHKLRQQPLNAHKVADRASQPHYKSPTAIANSSKGEMRSSDWSIGQSTNIIPVDTSTRISAFGAFGKLNRPQHIHAPSSFISPHRPRLSLVTVASHAPRARMSPQRPPQTNPLVLPLPHRPYEPTHRPWRDRRAHFRYAAMSPASSRRL